MSGLTVLVHNVASQGMHSAVYYDEVEKLEVVEGMVLVQGRCMNNEGTAWESRQYVLETPKVR